MSAIFKSRLMRIAILGLIVIFPNIAHAGWDHFVSQVNIFLGEVASNLTLGAPLSVSLTGTVQSGIPNYTSSTTTATTCATGSTTVTGISITPVAGTYLIVYSTDVNSANGGTVVTFNIDQGGSAIAITQRKFMPFAGGTLTSGNQRIPFSVNTIQALSGSAITVTCLTSASTATTANSELNLVRLQ